MIKSNVFFLSTKISNTNVSNDKILSTKYHNKSLCLEIICLTRLTNRKFRNLVCIIFLTAIVFFLIFTVVRHIFLIFNMWNILNNPIHHAKKVTFLRKTKKYWETTSSVKKNFIEWMNESIHETSLYIGWEELILLNKLNRI